MKETSAFLEVKDITKYFPGKAGSKLLVLDGINMTNDFKGQKGSIVSILAPFTAGKSTLLKIISAIEKPNSGKVLLDGTSYDNPDGRIVYIPEKPSSYPWLNVEENIMFASSNNKGTNIEEMLSAVGLTGYGKHYPHPKSTGFRFRISLARALAVNPVLILLDDPFKKLRGETKKEIYNLLKKLRDELNLNFLLGTTNITEVVGLSDKIYLMKGHPGKIFREIEIDRETIEKNISEYCIQDILILLHTN